MMHLHPCLVRMAPDYRSGRSLDRLGRLDHPRAVGHLRTPADKCGRSPSDPSADQKAPSLGPNPRPLDHSKPRKPPNLLHTRHHASNPHRDHRPHATRPEHRERPSTPGPHGRYRHQVVAPLTDADRLPYYAPEAIERAAGARIQALAPALRALGWERSQVRIAGPAYIVWVAPGAKNPLRPVGRPRTRSTPRTNTTGAFAR